MMLTIRIILNVYGLLSVMMIKFGSVSSLARKFSVGRIRISNYQSTTMTAKKIPLVVVGVNDF